MGAKEIGMRVREIRESRNCTQRNLATKCGVGLRTLTKLEHGDVPDVRLSTLSKLADALQVPLSSLVDEVQDTSINDDGRIARRNYIDRDPLNEVSTFVELALIIPVLDQNALFEACMRIGGNPIGLETHAARLFSDALTQSQPCAAKRYVTTVLSLIHEFNTVQQVIKEDEYSSTLQAMIASRLQTDPEFLADYEAYTGMIEHRLEAATAARQFASALTALSGETKQ